MSLPHLFGQQSVEFEAAVGLAGRGVGKIEVEETAGAVGGQFAASKGQRAACPAYRSVATG